jgi:hypothetical protein
VIATASVVVIAVPDESNIAVGRAGSLAGLLALMHAAQCVVSTDELLGVDEVDDVRAKRRESSVERCEATSMVGGQGREIGICDLSMSDHTSQDLRG